MKRADLAEVARVDLAAFSWAARQGGLPAVESERHMPGLAYFLGEGQGLCLVVEKPGRSSGSILGYAIGHRWGSVAWVGPLGVDVPFMGRGIGTALLEEFCRRSKDEGATTIGLETSLGRNIEFYGRRGFLPGALRLLTSKELSPAVEHSEAGGRPGGPEPAGAGPAVHDWSSMGQAARHDFADTARHLSGKAKPRLDHTAEFDAVAAAGIGETLVATWPGGELAGYAVVHYYGARTPVGKGGGFSLEPAVWVLVGCEEATAALLREAEVRAVSMGAARLRVPCYAGGVYHYLLLRRLGYEPEVGYARLFLGGPNAGAGDREGLGGPAVLEYSAWLG